MYKIDRRRGGGVQKSFTRTDPVTNIKLRKFMNLGAFVRSGGD